MRGAVRVTQHAIERFQERVANVSDDDARAALSSPTIVKAASFGCRFVKLGTGQHVVLWGNRVVTVIPAKTGPRYFDPSRDQLHDLHGESYYG